MRYKFLSYIVLLPLFFGISITNSHAQNGSKQLSVISSLSHINYDPFTTSPADLDKMDQIQLNAFSNDLLTSLYTLLSRVGSKNGEIGGKPNMVFRDAVEKVKNHLDENVLILSSRHSMPFTKQTYLPSDYDKFIISDLHTTHPSRNVIVIRYNIQAPNRVQLDEGVIFTGQKMPRMSSFIWNTKSKDWRLISHADFDYPTAAICGLYKETNNDLYKDNGTPEDLVIAHSFVDKYISEMMAGDPRPLMHPNMQTQFGSGKGWTGVSEFHRPNLLVEKPKYIVVRRTNNLIIVSFSVTPSKHMALGDELRESLTPVIYTILEEKPTVWKIIASAVFATPKKLGNGVSCIQPTTQ